jgi:glycosyltransferase involved in cell wall biosynthesis
MPDVLRNHADTRGPAWAVDLSVPAPPPRLRVAIVAPSLEIVGGQGVQARSVMDGLRAEGYDLRFVPINPPFPRGLRWLRRVKYVRTLLNQLLYLPGLTALRTVDVVHVYSASYLSFLLAQVPAMLVARALGKRVVLNYHSGEADDHLARWGVLVHPWLRLAHEIVVPSVYLQRVFTGHGYRARVIRNVVDTSRFRFRERAPLRPRLLCTRNFEPYYRVDVVIEAFARVRERYPGATLTLAGIGSEETSLRRLAAARAPGAVEFLGRVEPWVMPRVYDRADIFVNASVVDNQPLSVLEALAAGLPVVTTAPGDIANLVCDGISGRVVPMRDPEATAAAIVQLLEDPPAALRMARCARETLTGFAWAKVRHAWADAYCGKHAAPPPAFPAGRLQRMPNSTPAASNLPSGRARGEPR